MALETVTRFADGGVPTEAEMNELLDALKVLLNSSGLPATAFPWPLIALGNIDMNGFDIVNSTAVGGVLNVNAAKTLATAITEANVSGNTTIQIDPGVVADTTLTGVTVTGNNITIRGGGGATIDFIDLDPTPGYGLTVTGDGFTLEGVTCITSGTGVNMSGIINLDSTEDALIRKCTFDACERGIFLTENANKTSKTRIESNIFDSAIRKTIIALGANDLIISDNVWLNLQTLEPAIQIDATVSGGSSRISIMGNTFNGTESNSQCIETVSGARNITHLNISGNVLRATVSLFLENVTHTVVANNTMSGTVLFDATKSTFTGNVCEDLTKMVLVDSVASGNFFEGVLNLESCNQATITGNTIVGAIGFLTSNTALIVGNNSFKSSVVFPNGIAPAHFMGNIVTGDITDIQFADVFGLNNVTGSYIIS